MTADKRVKSIAEKWYKRLDFPKEYDGKFYKLLDSVSGFSETDIFHFDLEKNKGNYRENAVYALYFCEETENIFKKRNIPDEILLDTLWDIKWRITIYTDRVGEMGLDKLCDWLHLHLKGENIKLGRLQYQMRTSGYDFPESGISKGEPMLAVHIPSGPKLTMEIALESFSFAEDFFREYFPDYKYKCFTCNSWLLDEKLIPLLPEGSNILGFQSLFNIVFQDPTNAGALMFAFPHGTTAENLKDYMPKTSLQKKIRDFILSGGVLNLGFGIREKQKP